MSSNILTKFRNLDKTRPALYISGLFRNWRECFVGGWHLLSLMLNRRGGDAKSVLIVEFNPFHGETLPGYVDYFQELGYDVTVLTRHVTYADSPFVRMKKKPRHFCLTIWGMRHYLKSSKARQYSVIFYNSLYLYLNEYRYIGTVRDFLGGAIASGNDNWFGIEHHFYPKDREALLHAGENSPQWKALMVHTFLLTSVKFGEYAVPMLNPCIFGDVKERQVFSKDQRLIFLAIGNVSRKTRNFPELFKVMQALDSSRPFELRIIGKVVDDDLLEGIPDNIHVLGRLTFEQMYNQLEEAHFFLPLLSPEAQANYLDGCTSGSRQLVLGFCIPPIIHRSFAQCYGFSEESCLAYDDANGLQASFEAALRMHEDEYIRKCCALASIRDAVKTESFMNLKRMLDVQQGNVI